jgi:hypothetical protein
VLSPSGRRLPTFFMTCRPYLFRNVMLMAHIADVSRCLSIVQNPHNLYF